MGPPTNLLGLVLFVGLIVPGFAYLSARDTLAAERHRSPLRELAAVVMVSIACDVLAAGLFGAWRAAAPGTSLDLGGLVRGGGAFAELHYLSVAVHAMAFVLVASLLGALAGLAVGRRTSVGSRAIVPASGWTRAFSLHADSWKELHCELQDGTVVSGILYSWGPRGRGGRRPVTCTVRPDRRAAAGRRRPRTVAHRLGHHRRRAGEADRRRLPRRAALRGSWWSGTGERIGGPTG